VGGSAFACFKPEAVKLITEQPESRQNLISCQITTSSYLGSLVDLKLTCATSGVPLRAVVPSAQLNCLSSEQQAGAMLYLSFEPQAVSVIPL
jgi:hypothetical protein